MSARRRFLGSPQAAAALLLAVLFSALGAVGAVDAAWAAVDVVVSTPGGGEVLVGTSAAVTGVAAGDVDLSSVDISVDGGATWSPAIVESGAGTTSLVWRYTWALPAEDNSIDHTIAARVTDTGGGVTRSTVEPTVRVDTLAPSVTTFLVDDDAPFTGSTEVTLTIDAVDGSAPMAMQFSNDGVAWSNWWPYGVGTTWTLSPGDGVKVVRARFRDGAGNVTPGAISDTITLSTTGPTITAHSPADGATGVSTVAYVQTAFSSPMDPASLTAATVQLWQDGDGDGLLDVTGGFDVQVPGTVSYDDRTYTVTMRPLNPLAASTRYFSRVLGTVRNAAGLELGAESVADFTTGVSSPLQPGVSAITPTNGATGVPVTSTITIIFDREMETAGLMSGITLAVAATGVAVPGSVVRDEFDARVVYFYPAEGLDLGAAYTLTVSGSVQDYFGQALGADVVSAFSTGLNGVSPHGTFTSGSSVCAVCHSVHSAAAPGFFGGPLLTSDRETALCYTCHDGSGASTNVQTEFAAMVSGHVLEDSFVVPGPGLTTRCSSCHDPHVDAITRPKLPPLAIGAAQVTGNNYTWCEGCHDDSASWAEAGYPYPSGSIEATQPLRAPNGYPSSGTFPGATAFNDTQTNAHNPVTSTDVVWPGSGLLSGDCRNCHVSHGGAGQYDALRAEFRPTPDATSVVSDRTDGTYAALCFTCHDGDGPSGSDIKQFTSMDATATGDLYTGGHRIATGGGTLPVGAPLPCYDCHNPHGSKGNDGTHPNKSLLSDEQWSDIDTSTTAGVVGFCMKCHLAWEYAQGSEQPEAGGVPTDQAERIEGLDRTDPANKLSLIPGISAHGKANMETPTGSCYDCHTTSGSEADYAAPTGVDGFNVHRPHPGTSGCTGCHSQSQGARRAVVGEFAGTSHHVVGGDVTDADCGVCHMERDAQTGAMDPNYHASGSIDFRGPDSGTALAPVTRMVRDTASNVIEPEVVMVQSGLCLACHDANGASSPVARVTGATALQPFSANSHDAPNIWDALDTSLAFDHAVRGAGDNPYATSTAANGNAITMVSPWNQAPDAHDVISCFDCHETSAGHGAPLAYMGRSDFTTAAGQRDLCLRCHSVGTYEVSGTGSRFEKHAEGDHQLSGGNAQGCRGCHAGKANLSGAAASNGAPGNIHGGGFVWPADSQTPGSSALHFLYGGYLRGWSFGPPPSCWGGASGCHDSEEY